jgi:hypothetical protein
MDDEMTRKGGGRRGAGHERRRPREDLNIDMIGFLRP